MYSCDCEDCKTSQLDGSNDYSVFENVLKAGKKAFKYLLKNGGYKAEDIHHKPYQNLINETNKVFQKVVQDNVMSKTLQNALASDAFLFGSLKTHAQLFEANTLLLNKNGVIKSQNELEYELDKLNVTYNNNYLEAERQFAISSSINADKWSIISNRYNLQYRTVNDDKVRDNHRVLHDIVLPLEDDFWKKYYPPNGWRCRCVAVEVRKSKYPESDSAKAIEAGEKATSQIGKDGKNRLEIFRFNPGVSLKLMPPEHPYNKVSGADVIKKHNDSWEQINTNYKKGSVSVHKLTDKEGIDYTDVKICCEWFAKNEDAITEILPKLHFKSNEYKEVYKELIGTIYENKSPDFRINGMFYELEGFTGSASNKYSKMLSRGIKQSSRIVLEQTNETDNHLKKLIHFRIFKELQNIEEVWVKNGKDLRLIFKKTEANQ